MKGGYPELRDSVPRIQNVIREEEERFLRNLENGMGMISDTFKRTKAAGSDTIDGREAFKLHDTYGIPIEITESLAADQNLRVDMADFKKASDEARKIARGTAEAADVFATGPLDALRQAYHHGSEFLGYETTEADGNVIGILEQGQLAESASASTTAGPPIALILDRTPFYAESGGQIGDTGTIRGPGFVFTVEDTRKDHDFILHTGRVTEGTVTLNARGGRRGGGRPSPGHPPGPLGDPPAAPRPPPAPGQARPASRQQGRARPAPVRLRQPRGRRQGAARPDRDRPSTPWS